MSTVLSGWAYYPGEFYVVKFNNMSRGKLGFKRFGLLSGGLLTDVYCTVKSRFNESLFTGYRILRPKWNFILKSLNLWHQSVLTEAIR